MAKTEAHAGADERRTHRPLNPVDFLDLDTLLTDEERMIRDTVRQYVQERVLPDIEGWFERGEFPKDVFKELGALGLLGMHLKGY